MASAAVRPQEQTGAATEAVPAPRASRRRGVFLATGLVAPVALAWMLSMLAIPRKPASVSHHLTGPFVAHVSPSNGFQVNLADRGSKHYLAMNLKVGVEAYREAYVHQRSNDALHQARLSDAVLKTASKKTKADLDAEAEKEEFREELRQAIDAVLFPLHLGDEDRTGARHEGSGLRAGTSWDESSFRGLFHEHVLMVDAAARTIGLGGGPVVSFRGDETDLRVDDAIGDSLYLDVSRLRTDFQGEVPVGVLGRVHEVYFSSFLTQ